MDRADSARSGPADAPRRRAHRRLHPGDRWVRLGLALLLGLTLAALVWSHGQADVLLAWVKTQATACRGLVEAHPAASWLGYLLLAAILINCPIPAAALLKVLAGSLFGLAGAWSLNILVSTLGCALGFTLTRHFFYRAFYERYSHQLARANLEIARNGFWYVLACRLFVVTPFFLTNIAAGLSSMRLRTFVTATALGVVPSSLLYSLAGGEIEHLRSTADLLTLRTALVLAALAAAALAPPLVRRRLARRA